MIYKINTHIGCFYTGCGCRWLVDIINMLDYRVRGRSRRDFHRLISVTTYWTPLEQNFIWICIRFPSINEFLCVKHNLVSLFTCINSVGTDEAFKNVLCSVFLKQFSLKCLEQMRVFFPGVQCLRPVDFIHKSRSALSFVNLKHNITL